MNEEYCRCMIESLRKEYQERIDPYLKRLAEIESRRTDLICIRVSEFEAWWSKEIQEQLEKHPVIGKLAEGEE